jgi:hypothetical protein
MIGVAPILPSRDLSETATFYARLGFEQAGLWPNEYLIVARDDVGLHFFFVPDVDPPSSIAGCYLYVADADSLFAELLAVRLPSEGIPRLQGSPRDTDYGCASSRW